MHIFTRLISERAKNTESAKFGNCCAFIELMQHQKIFAGGPQFFIKIFFFAKLKHFFTANVLSNSTKMTQNSQNITELCIKTAKTKKKNKTVFVKTVGKTFATMD